MALRSSSPPLSAAPSAQRVSLTSGVTPAITYPLAQVAPPAAVKSSPTLHTFATCALGLGPALTPRDKGATRTATPPVTARIAPSVPHLTHVTSAQAPKGGAECAQGRSVLEGRQGRPPGCSHRLRQGGKRGQRAGGGLRKYPGRHGGEDQGYPITPPWAAE